MASAQWLLNQTSVSSGGFWNVESGGSYKLKNVTGVTLSRTTSSPSPYEGAGCYTGANNGIYAMRYQTSANADVTGVFYEDYYFYRTSSNLVISSVCFNDTTVEYSYVVFNTNNTFTIATFDAVFGELTRATSSAVLPSAEWFRVQVKRASTGITEVKIYKGTGINGTTPDATISWTPTFSNYEYTNTGPIVNSWIDDIKFDDTAYPTRSTAHTAEGTSTITATGTAAMSNARVGAGTGTGTATGTGAASRGQSVTGSASVTATGTADAVVTALVTIDGPGSATASATAGASSTQVFAGSATVTATGAADSSIRPLVTVDGAGTITATGAGTVGSQQTLAASATATATATAGLISITPISASGTVTATATALALITTPGTLYGNAEKVAGLYGSSTKPTLTTRS